MIVQETCNDSHLVDIRLTDKDIDKILRGKFVYIECKKDDTEIFIGLEEEK
jgi:hypothetical protein